MDYKQQTVFCFDYLNHNEEATAVEVICNDKSEIFRNHKHTLHETKSVYWALYMEEVIITIISASISLTLIEQKSF